MKTKGQLVAELNGNRALLFNDPAVIKKIRYGVQGYIRIQTAYSSNNMDEEFKKYYSYFYRMNRYTSNEYKTEYFNILQEIRNGAQYSFSDIADRLYRIDNVHQFSFITKLIHTTNTSSPIYDSLVKKVLNLPGLTAAHSVEEKSRKNTQIIDEMTLLYDQLTTDPVMLSILSEFDAVFDAQISIVKKIDFIIWAYGII